MLSPRSDHLPTLSQFLSAGFGSGFPPRPKSSSTSIHYKFLLLSPSPIFALVQTSRECVLHPFSGIWQLDPRTAFFLQKKKMPMSCVLVPLFISGKAGSTTFLYTGFQSSRKGHELWWWGSEAQRARGSEATLPKLEFPLSQLLAGFSGQVFLGGGGKLSVL